MRPALPSPAFWALAFLTGAAGLVYEVVWARLLARPLGSTALATGTVLGMFLFGLAAGALLAARSRLLRRRPLWLFSAAEGGTGLWALALPSMIAVTGPLLLRLHGGPWQAGLRVFLVAALLVPPTMMMGAAFPALVQASTRVSSRGVGSEGGLVYAANTVGAAFGAAGAAFLLLPALGLGLSVRMAAGADLAAAAVALWAVSPLPETEADVGGKGASALPEGGRLVLAALFLSGAGTLAMEVAWTRVLSLMIGSSTYALGMVLAVVILGLGGGAALAARMKGRLDDPARARCLLARALALAALLAGAAHVAVPYLPGPVHALKELLSASPRLLLLAQAGLCGLLLLPLTLAMGAVFPAGLAALAPGLEDAGRRAGQAWAVNGIGSLIGALLAAGWAVPALGVKGTMAVAALLWLVGTVAAPRGSGRRRVPGDRLAWVSFVLVVLTFLLAPWPAERMAAGPYLYGDRLEGEVLFHRDGREATVTVVRNGPWLQMRVNGKVDASTRRDLETETLLGQMGVLLHPAPKRVLVVGFGSGITAASVLLHPEIEDIDCVELEPAVVEGGASWFRPWNRAAVEDRRLNLLVADGRAHLARSRKAYDLVISQPSNPWIAGMSDLFTREAFEAARESLRPGGLFIQWVQGYRFSPEDFQAVVRTFREVFPEASLWAVGRTFGDLSLVGGRPRWDGARVRAVIDGGGEAARELKAAGILKPSDLAGRFLSAGESLKHLAREGPVLTDDYPWTEYTAPLTLLDTNQYPLILELLLKNQADPEGWLALSPAEAEQVRRLRLSREMVLGGLIAGALGNTDRHEAFLREALSLTPGDTTAAHLLSRSLTERGMQRLEHGQEAEAVALLREAVRVDPNHEYPYLTLGLIHERRGESRRAAFYYERYLGIYPNDADALERLAAVRDALGEADEATALRKRAHALAPSPM